VGAALAAIVMVIDFVDWIVFEQVPEPAAGSLFFTRLKKRDEKKRRPDTCSLREFPVRFAISGACRTRLPLVGSDMLHA